MMDQDDFEEIRHLLERCCDNCLLTRRHCLTCRIDKLRGIISQLTKSAEYELINKEELKVLVSLAGSSAAARGSEPPAVVKWKHIVAKPKAGK